LVQLQAQRSRVARAAQVKFALPDEPTRAVAQQALWTELDAVIEDMAAAMTSHAYAFRDFLLGDQQEAILREWTPLRDRQSAVEGSLLALQMAKLGDEVTLEVEAHRFEVALSRVLDSFEDDELLREYAGKPPEELESVIARWRAGCALFTELVGADDASAAGVACGTDCEALTTEPVA